MFKRFGGYMVFALLLGILTACNLPEAMSATNGEIDAAASVTAAVMMVVAEVSPTPVLEMPQPTVTPVSPSVTSTSEPARPTDTPVAPTNTTAAATPTPLPALTPTAIIAPLAGGPPRINNSAPGGTSAAYAEGEVIVNDYFLFRIRVLDTRFGKEDGAGINYVEFFVSTENGDQIYSRRETNAAYCIFGGEEPNCNSWPQRDGRYVWGEGGPEVQPGKYFVSILVTPKKQAFQGETWNWNFDFSVSLP